MKCRPADRPRRDDYEGAFDAKTAKTESPRWPLRFGVVLVSFVAMGLVIVVAQLTNTPGFD